MCISTVFFPIALVSAPFTPLYSHLPAHTPLMDNAAALLQASPPHLYYPSAPPLLYSFPGFIRRTPPFTPLNSHLSDHALLITSSLLAQY